nr:MAG TPA: hypothetical protein [Crassvirales sp.]
MANLWKQGVQENKDFWKEGKLADKAGAIAGAAGALGNIVGSSFNLAKGNKAALDNIKQQAIATNQQMVGSDSLDSIYNTALSYNPMSTNHKWEEFFADGGYLSSPYYDYLDYYYSPNSYSAGGKIISSGLSNIGSGAAAGMTVGGPLGAAIGGAVGLVGTAIGSIFGHSKAKKMAKQANAYAQEANDGMQYKINSAINDNAYNTLHDYENALPYAYGGYLGDDMGAIGYSLANDYLTIKDKQASNKQTPLSYLGNSYIKQKPVTVFNDNNSFAKGGGINIIESHEGLFTKQAKENGMSVQEFASHVLANKDKYPASTVRRANFARNANGWNKGGKSTKRYALGGDMQSNGGDYTDGLTEVNAGGTHEENPNGGVPMGMAPDNKPNLVEEGETIYNDYVFSNRIKPDKEALSKFHVYSKGNNMTYADLSKKLEAESKERPNDPISKDGLNALLAKLAQEQERQKAEEEEEQAKEVFEQLSPEEKQIALEEVARKQAEQIQAEQQAQQAEQQGNQEEQMNAAPEEQMNQEGQQVSPEEQHAMQQQMMQQQAMADSQATQEGYGDGGELHKFDKGGKKNVGTWKKGWNETKAWNSYAKAALDRMLADATADISSAKTPEERRKIQEKYVKKFNAIQRSYADAYQSPNKAYTYNDKVKLHQFNWNQIGGNNAYYPGNGFGIADRINLPYGANTADKYNIWNDGYWGPITSTRNLGSTRYGDTKFYDPYIKGFSKLGLNFGANKDYGYGNKGDELYTLSINSIPVTPDDLKPVNPPEQEKIKVPNIHVDVPVKPNKNKDNILPTWPRKVGMFGPLVGLGMQALGIGKNPGENEYNAAISAVNSVGNPYPSHIGNYIKYTPFDLWSALNRGDNSLLASNRGIMNTSGSNGSKINGLIASSNNYYQGIGNLMRQAQEYNMKNMNDVANFNRGTDQFNAQADNQFALAANQNNQWRAQSLLNYAAQKAAQDRQWYDDLYGNINDLFTNISNYGRENMTMNQINANVNRGVFGNTGDNKVNGSLGGNRQMAAKGGKLNKRKRRGYTF